MKYKITEIDTDAASNVAVKVDYLDDDDNLVSKRVFHFNPENDDKDLILAAVKEAAPVAKENPKKAAALSLVSSLDSSLNKAVAINSKE